jgi:hypothetical protein
MFEVVPEERRLLTLYTDAYVIKGSVATRQHRLTDVLNNADLGFLVLEDVIIDEFGSRAEVQRAEFAQVNLDAILFAVSDTPVAPLPELRIPREPQQALISVPPFKVVGYVHLAVERSIRDGLESLTGRFVPVTEATYWSETLGEARTPAVMLAVNHHRAQVFAPYTVHDPWAGMPQAPTDESTEPPPAG